MISMARHEHDKVCKSLMAACSPRVEVTLLAERQAPPPHREPAAGYSRKGHGVGGGFGDGGEAQSDAVAVRGWLARYSGHQTAEKAHGNGSK